MRLKKRKVIFRRRPLVFVVFITLILGGYIVYQAFRSLQSPPRYANDIIAYSTQTPSEEPIGPGYTSGATGDEPAVLVIPKMGISAPIQKVGIDQRGEVAVPSNIHIAGWFIDGAKPGEAGLSIIDGHLNGIREKGVFWRLTDLTYGDTFTIERADKKQLHYEVFAKKIIKTTDAVNILFSQDPTIKSQLNLITCAGAYDKQSRTYDQRAIINTRLIEVR